MRVRVRKENSGDQEATFLDLNIIINENKFTVSLYDKRDGFPFSIVRMPFRSSNMPSSIFYSAIGAEILRIARTTSIRENFLKSAQTLINRMMRQGALKTKISRTLVKTFGSHMSHFMGFYKTSVELVNHLLP